LFKYLFTSGKGPEGELSSVCLKCPASIAAAATELILTLFHYVTLHIVQNHSWQVGWSPGQPFRKTQEGIIIRLRYCRNRDSNLLPPL